MRKPFFPIQTKDLPDLVANTDSRQWGNLLILSVVRTDPVLGRFVNEQTLKELFDKTIEFFKIVAHPSSSLAHDLAILKGLREELESSATQMDRAAGSSFSSATTMHPATPSSVQATMQPPSPSDAAFAPPPVHHPPYTSAPRNPPAPPP